MEGMYRTRSATVKPTEEKTINIVAAEDANTKIAKIKFHKGSMKAKGAGKENDDINVVVEPLTDGEEDSGVIGDMEDAGVIVSEVIKVTLETPDAENEVEIDPNNGPTLDILVRDQDAHDSRAKCDEYLAKLYVMSLQSTDGDAKETRTEREGSGRGFDGWWRTGG